MNFDVYYNVVEEVKQNENETTEKNTRKTFRNVSKEEAKKLVNEAFDSLPENAVHMWLNVEKTYEERLDAALKSEVGY